MSGLKRAVREGQDGGRTPTRVTLCLVRALIGNFRGLVLYVGTLLLTRDPKACHNVLSHGKTAVWDR